ncbi:MAG: guanylate kinase [Clostridia bacterium]|nr:guanylate kinase [Clostridia bacterium]
MLFAFVGCSGVGKNTIIGDLLNKHKDDYDIMQTLTTRDMREGECQGNPYYFVSMEEFQKLIDEGVIYEHEWIHGNLYGGSRRVLEQKKKTGKMLLKDIDILGANTLKKKLKDEIRVLSLFLYVDDVEILLNRLRGRGESEEEIEKRRKRFEMEMSLSATGDYMINNIDRFDTGRIIDAIIEAEKEGKVLKPSQDCEYPQEEEIALLTNEAKKGASLARVEVAYNGRELLIVEGMQRYIAAMRAGTFIQKWIRKGTDESLKSMDIDDEAFAGMIG